MKKHVVLFIIMLGLFILGTVLMLGEMSDWDVLTFITAKAIGCIVMYIAYTMYTNHFVIERVR